MALFKFNLIKNKQNNFSKGLENEKCVKGPKKLTFEDLKIAYEK